MVGVVAISFTVLPGLLETSGPPAPRWLISTVNTAQTGAYLGLAVWAGVRLSPRIGFGAPAFAAAAAGKRFGPPLRRQIAPGLAGGVIGGLLLQIAWLLEPLDLSEAGGNAVVPLPVRILYGGLTEEILTRWGLMTVVVWALWVVVQRRQGRPGAGVVWAGIVLSAIPFGAGHLPLVASTVDGLTAGIVVWVVGANGMFGLLAGFLFWRFGLESAVIAHSLAHVFDYLVGLAVPI